VRELGCELDEMKRKCVDAVDEAKRKLFRAEQLQENVQRMVFRQNQLMEKAELGVRQLQMENVQRMVFRQNRLMEKAELVARQLQMDMDCPQIQLEGEIGYEVRELRKWMRTIKILLL
jgi:hypothetical protein